MRVFRVPPQLPRRLCYLPYLHGHSWQSHHAGIPKLCPMNMSSTSASETARKRAELTGGRLAMNALPHLGGPYSSSRRVATCRSGGQFRVAHRCEHRGLQALLDNRHPSNVRQAEPRWLRVIGVHAGSRSPSTYIGGATPVSSKSSRRSVSASAPAGRGAMSPARLARRPNPSRSPRPLGSGGVTKRDQLEHQ
jgi:hypothetical protein